MNNKQLQLEELTFVESGLGYYASRTVDNKNENYATTIGQRHALITTVMGGNYGVGDSYLVVDKDELLILTYFGDGSASIKPIKSMDDVYEFIQKQSEQYRHEAYGFKKHI